MPVRTVKKPQAGNTAVADAPRVGPAWRSTVVKPIASLHAYEKNARKHSADQIEAIRQSIRKRGWTIPVLIDEHGMVIAGHGRLAAAELEGYAEVPCLVAEGWSESEKRAYILADNKLTERGEWDWRMVSAELKDLNLAGFDLSETGFEAYELDPLLAASADFSKPVVEDEDEDDKPKPHGATDGRSITVTIEQYAGIKAKIDLIRERSHDEEMSEGKALEVICAAYV